MATPVDAALRVHESIEDFHRFDPVILGTFEGRTEVDGECDQFQPDDVTIYAWRQGVKMTADNAHTTTPELEVVGASASGGGGGRPADVDIQTAIKYSLDVPLGSYVVAAINDGPCDGTWKKPTIGPRNAAVTTATLGPGNWVETIDFTLQLYPDILTFTTQGPDTVDIGGSTMLYWDVENASSVEIQPTVGTVGTSGVHSVAPTKETTYELVAKGPGGWQRDSLTVGINPPTIDRFEADDTQVGSGDPVKLTWRTTNATDVSIDPAIKNRGPVQADDYAWDKPTSDTTYKLTAKGPGGQTTDTVTVNVVPAPSVSLSADPSEVLRGHQSATLTWRTTNANTVDVANRSFSDADGQTTVKPTSDTTYTATAKGPGGTATASATVTVTDTLRGTSRVPLVHDPSRTVYGRNIERHYFEQASAGRFISAKNLTNPPVTPEITLVTNVSHVNLAVSHEEPSGVMVGPVRLYSGNSTNAFDGMSMENYWEGWVNVQPTTNLPGTVELAVDWVMRA